RLGSGVRLLRPFVLRPHGWNALPPYNGGAVVERGLTLMSEPIERLVDLTDLRLNRIYNMTVEEARAVVDGGDPAQVRRIDGSFAVVARSGKRVRMARS